MGDFYYDFLEEILVIILIVLHFLRYHSRLIECLIFVLFVIGNMEKVCVVVLHDGRWDDDNNFGWWWCYLLTDVRGFDYGALLIDLQYPVILCGESIIINKFWHFISLKSWQLISFGMCVILRQHFFMLLQYSLHNFQLVA